MNKQTFIVQTRENKTKAKQLRSRGILPANIYGVDGKSIAIQVNPQKFAKLYSQAGDTGLIYIHVEDKKEEIPVLIDEIQYNPVNDQIIHVAFKSVSLKEKIKAEIPIEIVGEFELPGAVLITVRNHIEVEALPTDLPDHIKVDINSLNQVGDNITLADLNVDTSKVEIMVGEEGMDAPVVLVQEVKEEVEEEVVTEEEETEGVEETEEAVKDEKTSENKSDEEAKTQVEKTDKKE